MKSRRRLYGLIGAGAALPVIVAAGVAIGQSNAQPADKAVAAGSKRVVVGEGQTEKILSATMKTSKTTDVMIHTALECSILTALTTDTANPTATAGSNVKVWIEVDEKIVSLSQVSSPPQGPTAEGDDSDKVTFCDREYSRTVTDAEGENGAVDTEDDYIRTKSSHGFNWVQMNLGSGTHEVAVWATLTESASPNADAQAEIGNRTLIVEPTKMANNAVISENGG